MIPCGQLARASFTIVTLLTRPIRLAGLARWTRSLIGTFHSSISLVGLFHSSISIVDLTHRLVDLARWSLSLVTRDSLVSLARLAAGPLLTRPSHLLARSLVGLD